MRRLLAPLLCFAAGCVLPPFAIEGKECAAEQPCPEGFFCAPRPGSALGVCSATQPDCPEAELGTPCSVGAGACQRSGQWICTLDGPACSELAGTPGTETCNGVDDDCNGDTDDASGCIASLAGGGPPGFNDGPAEQARFGGSGFLTLAQNGDLLVADTWAHALRRVDPSGGVVTLAGTGRCGFLDGPAAEAQLCLPGEVVEAPDGTLYFSDSGNARLRALRDGTVTTVAGTGARGATEGPALEAELNWPVGLSMAADGSVLIADRDAHRIRRFTPGPPATLTHYAGTGEAGYLDGGRLQMKLNAPVDIAGAFVTEAHLIRQVTENGASSLIAGFTDPGFGDNVFPISVRFNRPMQVAPSGGQLLLADAHNHRIRVTDLANGATASVMAGPGFANGGAGASSTRAPSGIVSLGGNTWAFLDASARLRKLSGDIVAHTTVDFSGGSWLRQTSDGAGVNARLSGPRGLALTGSGELWWVEPGPSLVRRLRTDGTVETVAGVPGAPGTFGYVNGAFGDARVWTPSALAAGPDGRIYVSDRSSHTLRVFDPVTRQVSTLAGPLTAASGLVNGALASARFSQPGALWVGEGGAPGSVEAFVFDAGNRVIRRVSAAEDLVSTFAGTEGSYGSVDGAVGAGQLANVVALCSHGDGQLWLLEDGRRLRRVAADGAVTTPFGALVLGGATGEAMVCESGGTLLIGAGPRLVRVDPASAGETTLFPSPTNRAPVGFVDGSVETAAALQISGIAEGAQALFFVDQQANRVRRLWQ